MKLVSVLTDTTFEDKIQVQMDVNVRGKCAKAHAVYSGVCVQCWVGISS